MCTVGRSGIQGEWAHLWCNLWCTTCAVGNSACNLRACLEWGRLLYNPSQVKYSQIHSSKPAKRPQTTGVQRVHLGAPVVYLWCARGSPVEEEGHRVQELLLHRPCLQIQESFKGGARAVGPCPGPTYEEAAQGWCPLRLYSTVVLQRSITEVQ